MLTIFIPILLSLTSCATEKNSNPLLDALTNVSAVSIGDSVIGNDGVVRYEERDNYPAGIFGYTLRTNDMALLGHSALGGNISNALLLAKDNVIYELNFSITDRYFDPDEESRLSLKKDGDKYLTGLISGPPDSSPIDNEELECSVLIGQLNSYLGPPTDYNNGGRDLIYHGNTRSLSLSLITRYEYVRRNSYYKVRECYITITKAAVN